MPSQVESAVRADSLVVRVTFFQHVGPAVEAGRATTPELPSVALLSAGPTPDLDMVGKALIGFHRTVLFADELREDAEPPQRPSVWEPDRLRYDSEFKDFMALTELLLDDEAAMSEMLVAVGAGKSAIYGSSAARVRSILARFRYRIASIEMRSPLVVVVEIPVAAYPALIPGLLLLAHRICRFGPRVSASRAKDMRDRALYDRQRKLILEGKADGFAIALKEFPMPDRMDFHSMGEDPDVVEMEELPSPGPDR
jgi:hypothetical protein